MSLILEIALGIVLGVVLVKIGSLLFFLFVEWCYDNWKWALLAGISLALLLVLTLLTR